MLKAEIRKRQLERMRSLPMDVRRELSERIADRFFVHFDLESFRVVHIFIPIESNRETDTRAIIDRIRNEYPSVEITVPRVSGGILETLRLTPDTKMKVSRWGVPEPIGNDFVDAASIDLVIVPLLAFDLRGHRVGYGKGFYDRFLSTCRVDCVKVGVSFFPHLENIDDANENDVRLDYCLTPFKSFKF